MKINKIRYLSLSVALAYGLTSPANATHVDHSFFGSGAHFSFESFLDNSFYYCDFWYCDTPDYNSGQPSMASVFDIRSDVNNDGFIDSWDDEIEENYSLGAPAFDEDGYENDDFVYCNDASDEVSNGPEDIEDLTIVEILPFEGIKDNAQVRVSILDSEGKPNDGSKFNILVKKGDGFVSLAKQALTVENIRSGIELAVEASDIVRDREVWDGTGLLRVEIQNEGEVIFDELPLKLAPLITQHDLGFVNRVFMSPDLYENQQSEPLPENLSEEQKKIAENLEFHLVSQRILKEMKTASADFLNDVEVLEDMVPDIWAQDMFEPAFVSKPSPYGAHTIRVMLRSANSSSAQPDFMSHPKFEGMTEEEVYEALYQMSEEEYFAILDDLSKNPAADQKYFLRSGGIALYSELRSQDFAAIQLTQDDLNLEDEEGYYDDTYNSTGNFTTSPPVYNRDKWYPEGRMVYGANPNPNFIKLLKAQGMQAPINVPTEWLHVGHVDEFINFIPAMNEKGWKLAVADPTLAYRALEEAKNLSSGENTVLKGKYQFLGDTLESYETPLDELLADKNLRTANDLAQKNIDKAIAILQQELELSNEDIIRIPVLYNLSISSPIDTEITADNEAAFSVSAYFPNAINGLYLGDHTFIAPKQFGPIVDGVDILQSAIENTYRANDIFVRWVDDFNYAHIGEGNIHCVTNATRDIEDVDMWW